MHIAFVGFGEAAQSMAAGLFEEGTAAITAYDIRFCDETQGAALREHAASLQVAAYADLGQAVADAEVVLSLVVGSAAVPVGMAAGKVLRAGQIFVDLNSISPDGKLRVAAAVRQGGAAEFVEGAVMARVPPYRHKVPILLAGGAAEKTADMLNAIGMQCEAVGQKVGQACASKMVRSIFVKGVEAVLIECLTAAERAGIRERTLDSISGTFPGVDWREAATYYITRTCQHGARRVTEMNEATATLRSLGMEAVLTDAIAQTIRAAHARFSSVPATSTDADYVGLLALLAAEPSQPQ